MANTLVALFFRIDTKMPKVPTLFVSYLATAGAQCFDNSRATSSSVYLPALNVIVLPTIILFLNFSIAKIKKEIRLSWVLYFVLD